MKKKLIKLTVLLILILSIIVGRFYYSVYASEYHCQINKNENTYQKTDSIRIGTYNIKSLDYNKNHLTQFNNDISDLDLDIICLQEVDKDAWRSGNIDMVKEMAQANDYQFYHFYSTMWILNGYYGLGILSHYPIKEVSSQLLPNSLIKEPRILTKTTVLVNGIDIDIYNTHLTYENNDTRIAQMNMVREKVDFNSYTILAGDFNSFGMNGDFNIDEVENINKNKTYTTFLDFAYPDDIFYSKYFSVIEEGSKTSSFSDHNILYAQLKFTNHRTDHASSNMKR
ncbi:MAG: endonuclease/exonuclease/phosphatase family protein [Faecalibacillus sp.]